MTIEKSTLRILLLGTPGIYIDDEPVQIQRRMLRWLLFYLACQEEMVGRSDLILLLWPDEPEEDARRRLRETLSKLRAQLPDPNLIITDQDRIGLDTARVYSDVLDFRTQFAQIARACAQTPATTPLTQIVYQKVVSAVRLWRSARFLAGMQLPESEGLNDWLFNISQEMENERLRLLERLVDHNTATGDVDGALQWLRTALEGDETNEALHYRLLALLHENRRYNEALNYCSYVQEVFRREGFQELPSPLLSLARKIREEATQPSLPADQPAWPSLAEMQVPFVGRQALLHEMQLAARRGSPVILFGEAGSGKSRLVRELFFSLKNAPRLLLAPARPMENRLPFQPIVDMLRHSIQADEWRQMDAAWVTPFALLLPEVTIIRPEVQIPEVLPDQRSSLLFEALRRLFVFLSKRQRFLFFLDNAQWADESTLAALAYLAERGTFGESGALVLAARSEETSPQLQAFLNRPHSAFSVQRLSIPPLDSEEIATLSHYILSDSFTPELVKRLERETGGNPLFLLETLRMVLDYALGSKIGSAIDRLPLASSVHALIRERLQRLSPYDYQVLSIAAVIGSEFSMELVEKTSMLPLEQVVQSLESLEQINLIKAALHDRPSGGYVFVHEKFREVLLLELSPARERLLHLRIARVLEQKQQGQSAEIEASLALHYDKAGELDAAFQHWLKSALYAGREFAKNEALAAYHRAEQILERLGPQASDLSIYQLYRQWGRLGYDFSDHQSVEQVYNRLLQYGLLRQHPLLTGSAYNGLAQASELRQQPEKGLAYLEKAASYIEQSGRLFERIEALNSEASFKLQLGLYYEAQHALEKALRLGEQAADAQGIEARAQTEYWLSMILTLSAWPVPALEMARRSVADAGEVFNQASAARSTGALASAHCMLGHLNEGLKHALTGLAVAEAMRSQPLIRELHASAGYICLSLGDLEGSLAHLQQVISSPTIQMVPFLQERAYLLLGRLYLFLGDSQKAENLFRQGISAGENSFYTLENQNYLAAAIAAKGDPTEALKEVDRVITLSHRSELAFIYYNSLLIRSDILVQLGRCEEIQSVAGNISEEANRRALPELLIRSLMVRSKSALRQGFSGQAAALAREAVDRAGRLPHLPLEIEASALWLEATRQGGLVSQGDALSLLRKRITALSGRVQNPELQNLLSNCRKAWTKSPDA